MFVYYCLILLIFVDFILEWFLKNKGILNKSNAFCKVLNFIFKYRLITIVAIVLVATFKSVDVGFDTGNYKLVYDKLNLKDGPFKIILGSRSEIGYAILTWILAIMKMPFAVLGGLIAGIFTLSMVVFINKLSTNKFMSMILFVALGTFAQILSAYRQILAMALILISIIQLIDKKFFNAAFLILFASLFHISALVCLILLPIRLIKPNIGVVIISFAIVTAGAFAFPSILKLIEIISPIDYYTKYYVTTSAYLNSGNLLNVLYTIGVLLVFITMYFAKYKLLKFETKEKQNYEFFLMTFMVVALFRIVGTVADIPQLLNRLNMYFFMILIVLIPLFVKGLKHNKKLYFCANVGVYVVAFAYMFYLYAIKNTCGVYPYEFMF